MLRLITATELKLHKAKYYLHRMKETQNNPYYLDFICELESFLMHAKSVTNLPFPLFKRGRNGKPEYDESCYLELEVKHKSNSANWEALFTNWHTQKEQEINNNPIKKSIMEFLRRERNIVVHYKNQDISVAYTTEVIITDFTPSFDSVEIRLIRTNGTEEIFKSSTEPAILPQQLDSTIKYRHTFKTNELTHEQDVILICEQYMSILEELVEDCRKQGFL